MKPEQENFRLFEKASGYAYDYMATVSERRVSPDEEAIRRLSVFEEQLPDTSGDSDEILKLLHEYGSPATVAQTAGRYFGFVNGGAFPVALAAKWLSDVWDQNAALYVISPIAAKLEAICEKWLVEIFGLAENTVAGFVSGTSTATLCGLAAARYALLKNQNWDVNLKGLRQAPKLRIVLGEQAHGTVFKALALLGFGQEEIKRVPVDTQGRVDASEVPDLDDRTIVILQAGNVNSGAFDPFDEICTRANDAGAWVHVDGAFGLWSAASKNKRHLIAGIEKADSWSADAHKTLNAPYDCGIILCKHKQALTAAMQASGSYIQYSSERDGMLYTPEMSRRARAVELWATLKFLGKIGLEQLVDRLCQRAQAFAELLSRENFRILNDVVFNQVLVACDTPTLTQQTLQNIQKSGECWCGGATWFDEPVIRISVCSWVTTHEDIVRSAAAFVKALEKARQTSGTFNS